MDFLEDLTRELRGTADRTRRTDRRPKANPSDRRETGDETDSADANTRDREDQHVCPFCETEFAASRGSCPECNAEIVLRGDR